MIDRQKPPAVIAFSLRPGSCRSILVRFGMESAAVAYLVDRAQAIAFELGIGEQSIIVFAAGGIVYSLPSLRKVIETLTANTLPWSVLRKQTPIAKVEFLVFSLTDAQTAEAMIGDIEERLPRIERERGQQGAQRWLWEQSSSSLAPLLWEAFLRAVGLSTLFDRWRRFRS